MIKILQGNCLDVLKGLDSESVDMCITSPPYYGLREYGHNDQLGLEPTYNEYIDKLVAIFDEVKRVLKDSGSCWVNISDSYGGSQSGGIEDNKAAQRGSMVTSIGTHRPTKDIMPKSLIGIPERFVIAMTDRGWVRRNTVIWYKANCMPSSATDRFTVDFEYLYFFTKKPQYYFEQQFEKSNEQGRNKRCVWDINPEPFSGAHFACYPTKLVYTPIKAGCPKYICKKCGKAREKVYEGKGYHFPEKDKEDIQIQHGVSIGRHKSGTAYKKFREDNPLKEIINDCGCNAGWTSGVVLDPFMGSGTTLKVARELGRSGIGIELNPEYCEMARKRIGLEQKVFGLHIEA